MPKKRGSAMWVFVGGPGQFIAGVPARDLTDDEARVYGVEGSPLYEPVTDVQPSPTDEE